MPPFRRRLVRFGVRRTRKYRFRGRYPRRFARKSRSSRKGSTRFVKRVKRIIRTAAGPVRQTPAILLAQRTLRVGPQTPFHDNPIALVTMIPYDAAPVAINIGATRQTNVIQITKVKLTGYCRVMDTGSAHSFRAFLVADNDTKPATAATAIPSLEDMGLKFYSMGRQADWTYISDMFQTPFRWGRGTDIKFYGYKQLDHLGSSVRVITPSVAGVQSTFAAGTSAQISSDIEPNDALHKPFTFTWRPNAIVKFSNGINEAGTPEVTGSLSIYFQSSSWWAQGIGDSNEVDGLRVHHMRCSVWWRPFPPT